jgi:enterobactin synthetase component D
VNIVIKQLFSKNAYYDWQVFRVNGLSDNARLSHDLDIANCDLPVTIRRSSTARITSFLAGRACAMQALRMAGSADLPMLGRTADGLPEWPTGFMGSISHAISEHDGFAIAVVAKTSDYQSIAIDCEYIFTAQHADEVAPLIASISEQRLGERLGLQRELWLTMIYSLKETLYKLLSYRVDVVMPFDTAEILSFEVESGQACLMLAVDWGDLPAGQRFWLKVMRVDDERIGDCMVSFGAE